MAERDWDGWGSRSQRAMHEQTVRNVGRQARIKAYRASQPQPDEPTRTGVFNKVVDAIKSFSQPRDIEIRGGTRKWH